MITTVTGRNMVSIPRAIADRYGIRPGWKLDWHAGEGEDEVVVRLVPDRAELARRLRGAGRRLGAESNQVEEFVAEREREDDL